MMFLKASFFVFSDSKWEKASVKVQETMLEKTVSKEVTVDLFAKIAFQTFPGWKPN